MSGALGNKQIMAANIRRHLDELGLNVKDFAKKNNFKYSTVLDWVNAKTYPRIDKIEVMANFFGVEKSDLVEKYIVNPNPKVEFIPSTLQKVTDTTSKLEHKRQLVVLDTAQTQLKTQTAEENSTSTVRNNVVQFPTNDDFESLIVHGLESAGDGIWQEDETDIEVRIPKSKIPEVFDDLALVIGDSMRPKLHNGDILFVTFTKQIEIGQIGVFRTSKGNFVKKLQPDRLESLNPDYKDIYFEEDEFAEAIGVVQDIYRK